MTRTLAESIATLLPGVRVKESRAQKTRAQETQRELPSGVTAYRFPRHYIPHTAQRERFHKRATTRFIAACAGRRGGKTQAGAALFIEWILRDVENKLLGRKQWQGDPHPPWVRGEGKDPEPFLMYFVIAPTNALLAEPKKALQRGLGMAKNKKAPGLITSQGRDENGIYRWWLESCGVRINFFSGERPDLLVGSGYAGGWCEEAARLKPEVWNENVYAALADFRGWGIFTTTPKNRNWLWHDVWCKGDRKAAELLAKLENKKAEDILDPEYTCVSWTTADNDALAHLAEEMEIARRQMPDAEFRRNFLADFDAFEGQVFAVTSSAIVQQPKARPVRCYVGYDKGGVGATSHRSAISILAQYEREGPWFEAHTDSGADMLPFGDDAWKRRDEGDTTTWATRLYHALRSVVGDEWRTVPVYVPPDASDVQREWKRYGFKTETAFTKGAATLAITWFSTLLHNGRLRLTTDHQFTCMSGLRYPAAGEHSRKPWVDAGDDEFDALRYAASKVLEDGTAPTREPVSAMGWKRL